MLVVDQSITSMKGKRTGDQIRRRCLGRASLLEELSLGFGWSTKSMNSQMSPDEWATNSEMWSNEECRKERRLHGGFGGGLSIQATKSLNSSLPKMGSKHGHDILPTDEPTEILRCPCLTHVMFVFIRHGDRRFFLRAQVLDRIRIQLDGIFIVKASQIRRWLLGWCEFLVQWISDSILIGKIHSEESFLRMDISANRNKATDKTRICLPAFQEACVLREWSFSNVYSLSAGFHYPCAADLADVGYHGFSQQIPRSLKQGIDHGRGNSLFVRSLPVYFLIVGFFVGGSLFNWVFSSSDRSSSLIPIELLRLWNCWFFWTGCFALLAACVTTFGRMAFKCAIPFSVK